MFYPVDAIEELMPDMLVYNDEPQNQVSLKNRTGNYSKSYTANAPSFFSAPIDKAMHTKAATENFAGLASLLPESVLNINTYRFGNAGINRIEAMSTSEDMK